MFDRIDYLKKHELRYFGNRAVVLHKKPSDSPPSGQPSKSPGVKSSATTKSPLMKILTKASPKQLKLVQAPKTPPPAQKSKTKVVMGRKGLVLNAKKKAVNMKVVSPKHLSQPKSTRSGQAAIVVKQTKSPRNSRPGSTKSNPVQIKVGTSNNRKKIAPSQSPARRIPQSAPQIPRKSPIATKKTQSKDVSRTKKSAAPKQKPPKDPSKKSLRQN